MLNYLEPWCPCTDSSFEDELLREVSHEHILHGVDAKDITRRQDMDGFLFELPDGRFANVPQTWSRETSPTWPSTEMYDSFATMERELQLQIDESNDLESG